MKLIHDCVRDVLINVEENLELNRELNLKDLNLTKYEPKDIIYTCQKLVEANYIEMRKTIDGNFYITNMTYNGHLFLDDIRDSKVWSKTKTIASRFSSVSLNMIGNIATQVISNLISSSM